jgi:hypothetical protein|tara:strand:- start:642 stop:809 length:168 start_codon:yes stop_codon:yes gene_type:complete
MFKTKKKKRKGSVAGDSAGDYSRYSKSLYNSVNVTKQKRATSAKPVNIHGLNYKF